MKIPFVDLSAQYLSIKNEIDQAINQTITNTSFIGGETVKKFEKQFAELLGVKHVISCANGTDSLYIIMKMLGIGIGDEVITVANSWISSSETISQTGATPVFVDIDKLYYSIDESLIEKKINKHTKAIIAVHLQGQMCNIEAIDLLCKKHGLHLIEDCAQAHLSSSNGKLSGTTGIASSFSFYPGKNLGAYGDAGCMATNDDSLAEKLRMYANHGALVKHQHLIEGINSRLDGIQAAILLAKLPYLKSWTNQRIEKALKYNHLLSAVEEIETPQIRPNTVHSFHLYVIRCKHRERLMQYLKECEIECAIHYPTPLPLLKCYEYLNLKPQDFPVCSEYSHQILSLPIYPELTEEAIEFIAEKIKSFYKNLK